VHNPVSDGIPVTFGIAPDAAVIQPVVTGNQNRRGVSTPGIANARLIYLSRDTFTLISLIASVQSPAGAVETEREFELPLQRGELMLNVDPGNWMFDEYEGALAEIRLTAILLDGHGMLINNAPVLFTTNRARLYWYNHSNDQMVPFFPDPARKLTGIVSREDDEEPGQATVYLIAEEYDIYLDPFSLEVMVRINAQVEGYDDVIAEPAFIQFTRLAR